MKKLLLAMFCFAHAAALAAPPPSPSPAPTPAPTRAEDWEATKKNDDLYKAETLGAQFGVKLYNNSAAALPPGAKPVSQEAVKQNDAIVLHNNVLTNCVDTSLNGRKDDLCVTNPEHPECIGLSATMENTLCNSPGYIPKDASECKRAGTKDYTDEEWAAFSSQYFNGMMVCGTTKAKTANANTLVSLTDMVAGPGASGASSFGMVPTSGISGKTVDGTSLKLTLGDLKVPDDGSARLGYDNGEILKRAANGDTFYSVVMNSPVVEEMKPKNRAGIEHGLLEPNLTLDKARMAGRLPALGENLEQYKAATADPLPVPSAEPAVDGLDDISDLLGPAAPKAASASGASRMPAAVTVPVAVAAPPAAPAAAASGAPTDKLTPADELFKPLPKAEESKPLLLADRIARVEAAAKAARASGETGARTLASLSLRRNPVKAALARSDLEATSLFDRVHMAYRRQGSFFVAPDSDSGRDLRSVDAPKFFKDL